MDILCNFLILTGNYGVFWGGATIFYGEQNIANQYGNPEFLRKGQYGKYISSMWDDVKQGFHQLQDKVVQEEKGEAGTLKNYLNIAGDLLKGGLTAFIGNIFGGALGVAGSSQVPGALLSGAPSGYWHLTVGNPLDPIAMMGNMAVTKTTVQISDVLGNDDFPTEIKFTVDLEHCRPRDNAGIETMFNAGKGRFYSFANEDLEKQYHDVDITKNFDDSNSTNTQESQRRTDLNGNVITDNAKGHDQNTTSITERMKIIAAQLNF